MSPGVEVDRSTQIPVHTENGVTAANAICGCSVTPVEKVVIYLTEGNIPIRGDRMRISRGGKEKSVGVSGYNPAFIAQWGVGGYP